MSIKFAKISKSLLLCLFPLFLASCAVMPTSAPTARYITSAESSDTLQGIIIQNLDKALVDSLAEKKKAPLFSEIFDEKSDFRYVASPGDYITVTIWESYPQLLFGGAGIDLETGALTTGNAEVLPSQMVLEDGKITVPYVGHVKVAGRTLRQIEDSITKSLQGKANSPQVVVQFARNNTSDVTMLGDFRSNGIVPLTPRKERLLDAVASVGGAAEALKYTAVQFTRDDKSSILPIQTVIKDPKQNIELAPGDIITALYQPKSYTIMGAVNAPKETNFEVQGISLAQAIVRAGGLSEARANPSGVFVFRFEKDAIQTANTFGDTSLFETNEPIPTIYRIDYADPASYLLTQNFMIEDQDLIFVSNAEVVQLQKFLSLIGQVTSTALDGVDAYNMIDLMQVR